MNPELELRIRETYPEGKFSEPNESAYYGPEYGAKVTSAVNKAISESGIRFDGDWRLGNRAQYQLAFTSEETPIFSEWVDWDNSQQLAWIEEHGSFYPVLWVQVSRVYPAAWKYYNIWQPRGSTGYLDAVISEISFNTAWAEFEARLTKEFERVSICPVEDLNKFEKTWVTDEEFTDENGNDLPDDEVRMEKVSICGCLFPL